MNLVYALRKLPVATRLAIMGISTDDVTGHLLIKKQDLTDRLLEQLTCRHWRWRVTGDKVDWESTEIPGPVPKRATLIKKLRYNNEFTINQLNTWLYWFVGDKSELYIVI